MNTSMQPVLISAIFTATSDYHAFLQIRANDAPDLTITVIHDGIHGLSTYLLPGDGRSPDIAVQDCEGIIVLVRYDGDIIASGIFEVDTEMIETLGAVLAPCTMQNLLFDQCEASIIERGIDEALERAVDLDEKALAGSEAQR